MAGAAGTAASLATIGLAGCSGDEPGASGDTRTAPPRAGRRQYQGEIVIATLQNPSPAAQQALTKAYQAHQPGVDIRWETQDWPDKGLYATWLGAQLAAAPTRPDIISGEYEPGFSRYVDLEEYRWRTNPYTGNVWDEDFHFDRLSGSKRVRIGTEAQHLSWYYNQQMFEELSLEPPATWDQLVSVCQTIQAAGITPLSISLGDAIVPWFAPIYFDQYHTDWADAVRAREGDWDWNPRDPAFTGDPDDPKLHAKYTFSPQRFYLALRDRVLRFDTSAVVELMANLTRIFPEFTDPTALHGGDHYVPFVQRKTAMMVESSWALVQLSRDLDQISVERASELGIEVGSVQPFEWGVFEFPPMVSTVARSSIVRVPERAVGYEMCVVEKSAAQTAMTMDFLMFWLSKPGYTAFQQAEQASVGWVPRGFPLVADVAYPEDVRNQLERVEQKGTTLPAYGDFWVKGAGGKSSQDLRVLFTEAVQAKVSPQDYANQVEAYVRAHFAELLKQAGLTSADLANPSRRPRQL